MSFGLRAPVFLHRVNEGNEGKDTKFEGRIRGNDPPGRFVPAVLPREPVAFLGREGGLRICRISRRRLCQDYTHITRKTGASSDVVTSRVTSHVHTVTIQLNYTPNSRHMDNPAVKKGSRGILQGDRRALNEVKLFRGLRKLLSISLNHVSS